MKHFIVKIIKYYQKILSPDKGILVKMGVKKSGICVFYPSCSDYMIQAVEKYGIIKGLYKGIKRIIRCNPWQKEHIDPLK